MDVNNPADIAKKRKLQMELIIKDSDYKKVEQKKKKLEFEVHQERREIEKMKIELDAKIKEIKKIEAEQMLMMEDIKHLKKAMSEI